MIDISSDVTCCSGVRHPLH